MRAQIFRLEATSPSPQPTLYFAGWQGRVSRWSHKPGLALGFLSAEEAATEAALLAPVCRGRALNVAPVATLVLAGV